MEKTNIEEYNQSWADCQDKPVPEKELGFLEHTLMLAGSLTIAGLLLSNCGSSADIAKITQQQEQRPTYGSDIFNFDDRKKPLVDLTKSNIVEIPYTGATPIPFVEYLQNSGAENLEHYKGLNPGLWGGDIKPGDSFYGLVPNQKIKKL